MLHTLKEVIPPRYRPSIRYLYYRARYLLLFAYYKGSNLRCPFCNRGFRKFLPGGLESPVFDRARVVGGGLRDNVVCPRCTSTDRERLIYLYLRKEKNVLFSRRVRLLHVAPERSLQRALQAMPSLDYVSADIESPLAELTMDITAIELPDASIDAIICNHVLEHIPNDRLAMAELYRVLKPEGWAILQVPLSLDLAITYEDPDIIRPEDRERAFGQRDHVRIYGQDYVDRLKQVGFDVTVDALNGATRKELSDTYGLSAEERVYVCTKPAQDM